MYTAADRKALITQAELTRATISAFTANNGRWNTGNHIPYLVFISIVYIIDFIYIIYFMIIIYIIQRPGG